jgi:predicted AlkP superfamily phosphohydrolase/phosphomutase
VSIRTPFDGLLWIVWDGASCDVVNELLDQGDLPALRSLSAGVVVPLAPLSPNCQTPPSLASLYTGVAIAEHGVTGFRMPAREPGTTFVEWRSGFERPSTTP